MHWAEKFLKIEYKDMNCSKFVEHVLRNQFGINYSFPQSEGSLFNQSQQNDENILLINDPTNIYYSPYTILTKDNRVKREKSSSFYPTSNRETNSHDQCDQHIFNMLYNCSHSTECM